MFGPLALATLIVHLLCQFDNVYFTGRGGGVYSFHLWVGVCRWDPKTLGLYQTMYSRKFATLLQTGH